MSSASTPRIYSLPLFPLHYVLFPQFPLQLHIFEARYKAMIDRCVENNEPFGVVLIRNGDEVGAPAQPHDVGCSARILAIKKLDDGRMNLIAAGEERFRLLDYVVTDPAYLIGRVEDVVDDPLPATQVGALVEELTSLFLRYLGLLAERAELALPDLDLPDDPVLLAFCIASVSQISPLDKQMLLETTDTRARLKTEAALLSRQIDELQSSHYQEAAGHGSHPKRKRTVYARPLESGADDNYRRLGRN